MRHGINPIKNAPDKLDCPLSSRQTKKQKNIKLNRLFELGYICQLLLVWRVCIELSVQYILCSYFRCRLDVIVFFLSAYRLQIQHLHQSADTFLVVIGFVNTVHGYRHLSISEDTILFLIHLFLTYKNPPKVVLNFLFFQVSTLRGLYQIRSNRRVHFSANSTFYKRRNGNRSFFVRFRVLINTFPVREQPEQQPEVPAYQQQVLPW